MSGVKISNLPAIVTPAVSDIFPVVQSGTTYKETITQLASLVSSNIANNSITNAKLAQMGAYTIKGNNTNATADPQDIAAGQYPATHTNDVASPGNVGEVISAALVYGSKTALTTGVSKNITSISLTAGDWDVSGGVTVDNDGTALYEAFFWASTTSATIPDLSLIAGWTGITVTNLCANVCGAIQPLRLSLNATTTVYLSARATFASGNTSGSGQIIARRAR